MARRLLSGTHARSQACSGPTSNTDNHQRGESMRRLTTTLFTALTTLVLGALGPASASAHDVLVLSSGSTALDDQLRTILQDQGHVVTLGNEFTGFSGEGLAGQKVVVLLPNLGDESGDMPLAGQNALVNFVSAGGGLVTSEWTIYMSAFRSFAAIVPVLPVLPNVSYSESRSITYKEATPDPLLNSGVPSTLTFTADNYYGTETYFAPRRGATVFYTSAGGSGGAGVVGWQFGSGRVIQFSTVLGTLELGNATYGRLVANAVSWSGVDSNPVVSELKFEPATAQVGNSFVAKFAATNVTDDTYLDVRFRAPGSSSDLVVLNWQQGLSGSHGILPGTVLGNWTINGVRAHQDRDEHSGDFDAVSATLAVISSTCFITTPSGAIQGQDLGASCAFLGIPYAAAPLENLRWQPPQPSPPWSPSILFATSPPLTCAALNPTTGLPGGSEDCLKLNVWVPKRTPTPPAPVIVWIHTGAFVGSFRKFCSSQWPEACRTEWCSRCRSQLSSRCFRFPCPQRPHQRESGLPFIRQLRASGPACRYGLGEGQHRFIGRGPRQYHDCRAIGRGAQCESPPGIA